MIRSPRALVLVLLAACFSSHDGMQAVSNEDCATCHTADYNATSTPVHRTSGYPTTCADCHQTAGWQPALGLHPDTKFPIASGAHAQIKCQTCHQIALGAATAGANTNCVQCHPNSSDQQQGHVGAVGPAGQAYAYTPAVANFCLTCHPDGRASNHPDNKFPRTGNHNVPCASCHDRSSGPDTAGQNTTCVGSGCHHTLSWSDSRHTEVGQYGSDRGNGSNRHFCLACHPNGRGGD